jgi:uncharacterized protein YggE
MKKLLIFTLAAALLAGCCNRLAENADSYVEVAGMAEQETDADVFYLSINLNESHATKDNISAVEQKLVAALRESGVDTEKDLTVTGMWGDNWYWWRRSRTVYQNKSYELKVTDLALLNLTCDALDKMGYVNYNLSRVDYSKMDELKAAVQQQAVRNARTKADNLLAGENRTAGSLLLLGEMTSQNIYPRNAMFELQASKMMMADQAASTVNMHKIKVSYQVTARFAIK